MNLNIIKVEDEAIFNTITSSCYFLGSSININNSLSFDKMLIKGDVGAHFQGQQSTYYKNCLFFFKKEENNYIIYALPYMDDISSYEFKKTEFYRIITNEVRLIYLDLDLIIIKSNDMSWIDSLTDKYLKIEPITEVYNLLLI